MKLYSYQYSQLAGLDTLSLFRNQVEQHPEKIAACSITKNLTYAELDRQSSLLASQVLAETEQSESAYLALLFEHDVEISVAVIATVKSGKAYLPLDAAYPEARLQYMLENGDNPALLTCRKLLPLARRLASKSKLLVIEDLLEHAQSDLALPVFKCQPDSAAYLLYTSGSTGNPKGLVQSHTNLLYHTWVWSRKLSVSEHDKLSLQSAYSWDSSVQDLFSALLNGATLCFVSIKRDGLITSLQWMISQGVSVYHSTVPIFRQVCRLLDENNLSWPTMRILAVGGDSVLRQDVIDWQRLFSTDSHLAYAYGSSESSTTLMKLINHDYQMSADTLDLGEPADGAEVLLLDQNDQSVDEGEIVLTSAYIVRGYLKLGLDPERFTPLPDGRQRYYSGDLAKRLPSGSYTLLGRRDNQLKIRGIRVIPSEVESALMSHEAIREVVVMPFNDLSGERQLVAYVVFNSKYDALNTSQLRAYLADRVPDHCLPARYITLTELPLTPNGKIDRNALPGVDLERPHLANEFVAPVNNLQKQLADIWQRVLQLELIGTQDNFFDLGGQSLKMARVHALLQQELGYSVALVQLYAYPTIASLAQLLSQGSQINHQKQAANERALKRQQLRRRTNNSYQI